MRDSSLRPFAIFVGIVCFAIGGNVAAFWSQEIWSFLSDSGKSTRQTSREKSTPGAGGPAGGESAPTDEPPGPAGPKVPYDETVRRPEGDPGKPRAPAYRNLPDGCGKIQAKIEGGERTITPAKTDYQVDIEGDLAAVTVEQIFHNPTATTLDAIYQFPLNRRAAVYAMSMQVGDREIRAEIKRKKKAREIYKRADRRGKQAALLEQQRPNWFTQRVANIGPDDAVEIELKYVHSLPKEDGTYRLVVPTKLGERFRTGDSEPNDLVAGDGSGSQLPAESGMLSDRARQRRPSGAVSLQVEVDGPVPVRNMRSPTHPVRLRKYSATEWWVGIPRGEQLTARHFRLQFRLDGEQSQAGLNAYWDEEAENGYFSLLVEPPRNPDPKKVSNRELVFVMDTSGSMEGEPLRASKEFVKAALRDLRRVRDSFRIVQFADTASQFSTEPVEANEESVEEALRYVDGLRPRGGTQYRPGLEKALKPESPEGAVRLVIFLTDGHIGYEFEVLRQIRQQIGEARLFGIGVGPGPNRYLLEEMARMGSGFARFLQGPTRRSAELDLEERIDRIVRRIESPVMTHIDIDWGDLQVQGVSPEPVPDLYGGQSIRVHGTYSNPGEHEITVRGTVGSDRMSIPVRVDLPETEADGEAVQLTWARRRIRDHMHQLLGARTRRDGERSPESIREEIVDLGLEYGLTTQWTSYVAVSESGERHPAPTGSRDVPVPHKKLANRKVHGLGSLKPSKGRGVGGLGIRGGAGGTHYGGAAANLSGKTTVKPQVVPQKAEVKGSLDKTIIRKVVRQHRREIKYCYEKQLRQHPKLKGKVDVQFTISSRGDVVAATVQKSTLDNVDVETCIQEKIRKWKFPAVNGGGIVKVNYPFRFRPSN